MKDITVDNVGYLLLSQETMNNFDSTVLNYLENVNISKYIPRGKMYVVVSADYGERITIVKCTQVTGLHVGGDPERIESVTYKGRDQ